MKRLIYILFIFLLVSGTASGQVSVIANKDVPETTVSQSGLKNIFTLEKTTWSNGSSITVFDLKPAGETKTKFYGSIGTTGKKIKKKWMKKMLQGEGQAPAALSSEEEVLQKVASTPGAIGFVSSAKVNDTVKTLYKIN